MSIIKAPFNFVPVSDEVFLPEWAAQISHDIPFSNGKSGSVELTIKAISPVFVRNGHSQQDDENRKDNEVYNSFSNVHGTNYFIPATTLKGSIRNVLEIISFGKMALDKKAMFAQRDFANTELYTLLKPNEQSKIHCGWLCRKNKSYEIVDCGKPLRISHKNIDTYFGKKTFEENFSKQPGKSLNKEIPYGKKTYDPKTAAYKYKLLEGKELNNLSFSEDLGAEGGIFKKVKVNSSGDIKGSIVLTGQPDLWAFPRHKGGGKFYEFVFEEPTSESSQACYSLSEDDFEHFKFIYTDSSEWPIIREKLNSDIPIPVFFRLEKKKIKDFGMAFMYKLPYQYSPFSLLSNSHKAEAPDLASCIFGYTSKEKSLKGRVQFTHAMATNPIICKEPIEVTLGTPKASYYPLYIRQNGSKGQVANYNTYNDGKLSGWKRYMIRETLWNYKSDSDKLNTKLQPLDKGTKFKCRINYHNLRPEELGALLSALTFHNTEGSFHQIGQGKPYGLGQISIEAKLTNPEQKGKESDFMAIFEKAISQKIRNWIYSPQIVELFTISSMTVSRTDSHRFEYLKMSNSKDGNEFQLAKTAKEYLQNYSALQKKQIVPNSLYESFHKREEAEMERLEQEKKLVEAERIRKEKELEELKRAELLTQKIEAGLSFLNEMYEGKDVYKVSDFNGGKKRIDQWMKKLGETQIPVDQRIDLFNFLKRIIGSMKDKEKANWQDVNNPRTWGLVQVWIGKEETIIIFIKIIKEK